MVDLISLVLAVSISTLPVTYLRLLLNLKLCSKGSRISQYEIYILGDVSKPFLEYYEHLLSGEYLDMLYSNFSLLFTTKPTRLTHHSSTLIERIYRDFALNWMRFMGLLWLTSQIICQSFDRRTSRLEKCFAIIIISTWTSILEMPTLLICLVYSVNLVIFISKLLIV